MTRFLVLTGLALVIAGCDFDKERQTAIQNPATLEVRNDSQADINLQTIYSTVETRSGFVLDGGSIRPQATLSLKISESTYDAISAGSFVLEGVCGDVHDWRMDGAALLQRAVEDTDQWKITISIVECGDGSP